MDVMTVVVGLVAVCVGLVVGWLLRGGRVADLDRKLAVREAELAAEREQAADTERRFREHLATMESAREREEREADLRLDEVRAHYEARLEDLHRESDLRARERLGADRAESERQGKLLEAISPVRQTLSDMQQVITRLESERAQQYGHLSEQLTTAAAADQQLRDATATLSESLRNSRTRGAWGEVQLRNIVESAGLMEHVDFDTQVTHVGERGRLRPDLVVNLPGGAHLPVDSKTPMDAYLRSSAPEVADDPAARARLEAAHAKAVRGHVDQLAAKDYWKGVGRGPDFVVAFLPLEGLLATAVDQDPGLLDYAFSKRVALVTPVTFWALLRTVAYSWQQERLQEQAQELFELGRELQSRVATLADHAEQMRGSIEKTVGAWNRFAGSLESRVLVTARRFSEIDDSAPIAVMAPVDAFPRPLQIVGGEGQGSPGSSSGSSSGLGSPSQSD